MLVLMTRNTRVDDGRLSEPSWLLQHVCTTCKLLSGDVESVRFWTDASGWRLP